MPFRSDRAQARFGGEPCARCNVQDLHTGPNTGGTQEERQEVAGYMRKSAIIFSGGLVVVGKLSGHLRPPTRFCLVGIMTGEMSGSKTAFVLPGIG